MQLPQAREAASPKGAQGSAQQAQQHAVLPEVKGRAQRRERRIKRQVCLLPSPVRLLRLLLLLLLLFL